MKARFAGMCPTCKQEWAVGAEIEKWLGSWVHRKCKLQSRSALEAEAEVTVIPDAPVVEGKQTVRPKASFGKKKGHLFT